MDRKSAILMLGIFLIGLVGTPRLAIGGEGKATRVGDSFLGVDKRQHFVGSLIQTVFWGKLAEQRFHVQVPKTLLIGGGITFSMGIAKEIRDARQPWNHFCWKDLVADALGVAVGLVILNQP